MEWFTMNDLMSWLCRVCQLSPCVNCLLRIQLLCRANWLIKYMPKRGYQLFLSFELLLCSQTENCLLRCFSQLLSFRRNEYGCVNKIFKIGFCLLIGMCAWRGLLSQLGLNAVFVFCLLRFYLDLVGFMNEKSIFYWDFDWFVLVFEFINIKILSKNSNEESSYFVQIVYETGGISWCSGVNDEVQTLSTRQ